MCGRVIQSSGPLNFAIVDGMNVRDSRVHNYPPRWNAAPSQDLLVIRRNHRTGEVSLDPLRWGLIPNWCNDPQGGRKPIARLRGTSLRDRASPESGRQALLMHGRAVVEGEAAKRTFLTANSLG